MRSFAWMHWYLRLCVWPPLSPSNLYMLSCNRRAEKSAALFLYLCSHCAEDKNTALEMTASTSWESLLLWLCAMDLWMISKQCSGWKVFGVQSEVIFLISINLPLIFIISHSKCEKNAQHSFPEPKITSNNPNLNVFTDVVDKRKAANRYMEDAGTSKCFTFFILSKQVSTFN